MTKKAYDVSLATQLNWYPYNSLLQACRPLTQERTQLYKPLLLTHRLDLRLVGVFGGMIVSRSEWVGDTQSHHLAQQQNRTTFLLLSRFVLYATLNNSYDPKIPVRTKWTNNEIILYRRQKAVNRLILRQNSLQCSTDQSASRKSLKSEDKFLM